MSAKVCVGQGIVDQGMFGLRYVRTKLFVDQVICGPRYEWANICVGQGMCGPGMCGPGICGPRYVWSKVCEVAWCQNSVHFFIICDKSTTLC